MLKILGEGLFTIRDIRRHFQFLKDHGGRTFGMYEDMGMNIKTKYANKTVNPNYYGVIGDKFFEKDGSWKRLLTPEEFAAGKPGYVLGEERAQ